MSDYTNVICANMWAVYNFGNANDRYKKFLSTGKPEFQVFLENILLYDQVYVPTQDFLSLTILLGVLGEDAILQLLDHGCIKFIRINGVLVYTEKHLVNMEKVPKEGKQAAFCSSIDEAIEWAIAGLDANLNKERIKKKVIDSTIEYKVADLLDIISKETSNNIKNNDILRNFVNIRSNDLNNLTGSDPRKVTIYGGVHANSNTNGEIESALALAHANLELYLMKILQCKALSTTKPIDNIIRAKVAKYITVKSDIDRFFKVKELSDFPDIGTNIINNKEKMQDLLKIKSSKNCKLFRDWFHNKCGDDSDGIIKEYIKLLKEETKNIPVKALRFGTTTAIGFIPVIGSIIGVIASAVDSFFLDNLLKGSSPKYFFNEVEKRFCKD